jgi:hypothetical protein
MTVHEDTRPLSPVADAGPRPERKRRRSGGPRWLRRLRKRFNLRLRLLNLAIMAAVVLVVLGVGALVLSTDAVNRVQDSLNGLNRIVSTLTAREGTELTLNDFNRLQAAVEDARVTIQSAENQVAFLRLPARFNGGIDATLKTLRATHRLASAAEDMLAGLQPTLFFLVDGSGDEAVFSQGSSGERVVELLRLGRTGFTRSAQTLGEVRAIIDSIDPNTIAPDQLLTLESLNSYHAQMVAINDLLIASPDLLTSALGLNEPRNYLILSQNNDELRPSGGYISTYGWLTMRNGRITDYDYQPTTPNSPNPPPREMAAEVMVPNWWLRYSEPIYAAWDGSWYADFPSTAQMALWYYNNGNNPGSPVDGVIGLDIVAFENLLGAIGPVSMPEYAVVVDQASFREVIYDIRARGDGETHKEFLASLYESIFARWQALSGDPERGQRILGSLLESLREKHIMIYFPDPALHQAIGLLGWTGGQVPAVGTDYLMVADANLGNKSNRSVIRQITYDVQLQADNTVRGRASISYDYPASLAENDPAVDPEFHGPLDYNNLMQLFIPPGSVIEETNGLRSSIQQVNSAANTILVSRVSVPFDTNQRFQFTYTTPPVITPIGGYLRYRLLVQKQPGTLSDQVNVQVSLPPGAQLVSTTPIPDANYNLDQQILEFRLTLTTDQQIEVLYTLPSA